MIPHARNRPWLLPAVLLTAQFMANVDTAIVNVAAPSVHATLGASGGELELVVSGYVLAYAMLLITSARLGDMCTGTAGSSCSASPRSPPPRWPARSRPPRSC